MTLKTIFLLLGLVCQCSANQVNQSIYLANGPTDQGTPCYPTGGICTFTASTGDKSVLLGNIGFLSYLSTSDNSTLWFTMKDGEKVVPGFEKFRPIDLTTETKTFLNNYVSTWPEMTFEMHFEKGQSNAFINLYIYPIRTNGALGSKIK